MVLVSRMYQRALESQEGAPSLMRRVAYLRELATTPAAGKEIRTFGLGGWLVDRYRAEFRAAIALTRRDRSAAGRVSLASGAIVLAGEALTFVLLARGLMDGTLSVARFTVFAIAAAGLVGLSSVTPDLLNITVGGAMAADVRRLEARLTGPAGRSGAAGPPLRGAIVFEDVGFRYPGSDRWVLRHLDLTVRAGASLSVVGANGAGKTTLVKLLCGLYEPTEGRILVDGVDLATLDARAWQRRFAALFQDWVRWALPLRDNVLLGAPERVPRPGELDAVARGAGLHEVVEKLPAGWDTVLSREFGGSDLSGGQWQRVGLARALWALGGAEVLVLDEPTSALDVRGELELFDTLLAAAPGKTLVLVSHRFSTVRHTDRIVVLADGQVLEQGGHSELLLAGGTYARMFAAQADRFVTDGGTR
jgi:ABC-type multidrug transport system fused ATPase/permease subunit